MLSTPAGARREAARLRRQLDKAYTNTSATVAAARGGSQALSELSVLVNELRGVTDSWKRYLASLVREPDEVVARAALERARPDIEAVFVRLRSARSAVTQLLADTIACDQAGLDQRLRDEAEVLGAPGGTSTGNSPALPPVPPLRPRGAGPGDLHRRPDARTAHHPS